MENSTGARIRQLRQQKGLTLLDVARQLGVREATVQRYESGAIKIIKKETIAALAELFDCSPEYLLGWQSAPSALPAGCMPCPAPIPFPCWAPLPAASPFWPRKTSRIRSRCPNSSTRILPCAARGTA